MRVPYRMRAEVTPSEQALEILAQFFPTLKERFLIMVQSGSHVLNPYHNTLHELQNVYYSFCCFANEDSSKNNGPGIDSLVKASLFHDHNHSGGILRDDGNVARALEFAEREVSFNEKELAIIRCTQFVDGKFPIEPQNLAERSIRDADLMTIYSQEGFRLLLGLFEEVAHKSFGAFTEDDIREIIGKNENFLWAQKMYTDHGQRMKEEHLLLQLTAFEEYVWRQHKLRREITEY